MARIQVKCGVKHKPVVYWSKRLNDAAHEALRKKGEVLEEFRRPRANRRHKDTKA